MNSEFFSNPLKFGLNIVLRSFTLTESYLNSITELSYFSSAKYLFF